MAGARCLEAASPGRSPGAQLHHRVPRCLLGLRDRADAHHGSPNPTPEALRDREEYEIEALGHGVDPDVPRELLARIVDDSVVEISAAEHRATHSAADDFRRWGRRGGLRTLALYGTAWFALLARKRWKKATAGDLAAYLTDTKEERCATT